MGEASLESNGRKRLDVGPFSYVFDLGYAHAYSHHYFLKEFI